MILNLSNNMIRSADGIKSLVNLSDLDLSGNMIRFIRDCVEIQALPKLAKLDLRRNLLEEKDNIILPFLSKLSSVRHLGLKGNPFINYIAQYRENIISEMPALERLDDTRVYRHGSSLSNWPPSIDLEKRKTERNRFRTQSEIGNYEDSFIIPTT